MYSLKKPINLNFNVKQSVFSKLAVEPNLSNVEWFYKEALKTSSHLYKLFHIIINKIHRTPGNKMLFVALIFPSAYNTQNIPNIP